MAHNFNWQPGNEGKGNVYRNGDISTWNVDGISEPHHQERADTENQGTPRFLFYISPEGGIHDGGIGFRSQMPTTDEQMIGQISQEDPYLYDARNEQFDQPSYEGGGYGHAENLMEMGRFAANDWPDCHAELKIPLTARRQIRRWVDRLKWPSGAEKDDARTYHVTILSVDEWDDDFVQWMRDEIEGRKFTFKSTGMAMFGPDNEAVVLRLECPEWENMVVNWGEIAYQRGLEPRRFPGGARAHITVGKTDGKWPQGVPDPHIEFTTTNFNINKNAAINNHNDAFDYELQHPLPPTAQMVPVEALMPYREYDREIDYDKDPYLRDLRDHIAHHGIANALKLEYNPDSQIAHLGEGNHRLQIAQQLGMSHVPVEVLRTGRIPRGYPGSNVPQPPVPDQFGYVPGNLSPSDLGLPTKTSRLAALPQTPAEELKAWLDGFATPQEPTPSIHHPDAESMQSYEPEPLAQGYFVDPPSNPYKPYNWAEQGFEPSPLNRAAAEVLTHPCPNCGAAIDGQICGECGHDPLSASNDFQRAERDWYDETWSGKGWPRPFPNQPIQWRDDSATDVSHA